MRGGVRLARALAAQGLMPDAPDAPDAAATPADGLNLWLPLAADSQPLVLALARRGWLVRSGEPFGVAAPAHGLRITVSTLEEEDAGRLALDIARCWPRPDDKAAQRRRHEAGAARE